MKTFVAMVCALLLMPATAAKPAAAAPTDKLPEITPDDTMAGMLAAPDLVSQGGLDCQVSDARKIGLDDKTGGTFYELACRGGEGFIIGLQKKDPKKPASPILIYSCLETASAKKAIKNGAGCRLRENADPKVGIAALVAKDRPSCRMTDARAVGHTDSATMLEVACEGGAGYMIQASYPLSDARSAVFTPCAGYRAGMNLQCALTDAAATDAYLASIVAKSGKACAVKDHRFVGLGAGLNDNGDAYFEVACRDGDGFMLDVDAAGGVYPTPCVQADYMAGGCKLTRPPARR